MNPVPQPAKGVVAVRRITNRRIAEVTARSAFYVSRVLNGWVRPSKGFRRDLAEMLGVPESELFRADEDSDVKGSAA